MLLLVAILLKYLVIVILNTMKNLNLKAGFING
jgi:hypothetical protein